MWCAGRAGFLIRGDWPPRRIKAVSKEGLQAAKAKVGAGVETCFRSTHLLSPLSHSRALSSRRFLSLSLSSLLSFSFALFFSTKYFRREKRERLELFSMKTFYENAPAKKKTKKRRRERENVFSRFFFARLLSRRAASAPKARRVGDRITNLETHNVRRYVTKYSPT